jgi:hypothetical protein
LPNGAAGTRAPAPAAGSESPSDPAFPSAGEIIITLRRGQLVRQAVQTAPQVEKIGSDNLGCSQIGELPQPLGFVDTLPDPYWRQHRRSAAVPGVHLTHLLRHASPIGCELYSVHPLAIGRKKSSGSIPLALRGKLYEVASEPTAPVASVAGGHRASRGRSSAALLLLLIGIGLIEPGSFRRAHC